MADTADPLVLDFVEWVAREPRLYSEVIATWRTSCPRLTIWEDAVDGGYVARETIAGFGLIVTVTEDGEKFLREHGRVGRLSAAWTARCPSVRLSSITFPPRSANAIDSAPRSGNIHAIASILQQDRIAP
jgi:hypothetical protein